MNEGTTTRWPAITVGVAGKEPAEWVRFSLPVPEGRLRPDAALALEGPDGSAVHLQTRPLVRWADGSTRWLDCQGLVAQPGRYTLAERAGPLPARPVAVRETPEAVTFDNGLVTVTLTASGPSPIAALSVSGRPVSSPDLPFEAYLETTPDGAHSSAYEPPRALQVRERGPVRAVVDVSGVHAGRGGRTALGYRLRVTLIAGQPVITLQYGFRHEDAGVPHHQVRELSLRLRWLTPPAPRHNVHQSRYGMTTISRQVLTTLPADIRADRSPPRVHVHNTACFEDPHDYPAYLNPPLDDTLPLAGVETDGGWVTAWADDFGELCPKGLAVEGNLLRFDVWPRWAPALEIPQGRSRDATLHLVFSGATAPDARALAASVRAVSDTAKAVLPLSWYAANRCWHADTLLPSGTGARRQDRFLARLAALPTVVGMWDLGDTMDPGYSRTYVAAGRLRRLTPDDPPRYLAAPHMPLADWWHPGGFEPVWTNNEYDLILCLCREALRGNLSPDLWQRLRWFARHAVEVDFIRHSDDATQRHGSPAHSAAHNHAGAYPSHLWCEGLLAYYCLSGDTDALEVAVAVGDFILRMFGDADRRRKLWHFNRELGWALLYLSTAADITREERFLAGAHELADALMSEPITPALAREMAAQAFVYSSIAMGIEALWTVTRRRDLAEWLVRTARATAPFVDEAVTAERTAMILNYFNAALDVALDDLILEAGVRVLENLAETRAWTDPPLFAKPVAMLYRGVSRFAKQAFDAGLLAAQPAAGAQSRRGKESER